MRRSLPLSTLAAALLSGCAADATVPGPTAPSQANAAAATPDISGVWNYAEETFLVVKPDDVLQIRCTSPDGVLTINQTGGTFVATLVHPTGHCELPDGQVVPPPWGLPYEATLTGRITGRALHIDQVDFGTTCTKSGTIQVVAGEPVALTTVGRCDLSFSPFRPALATNSAVATRQ